MQLLRLRLGLNIGFGLGRYQRDGITVTCAYALHNGMSAYPFDNVEYRSGLEIVVYHLPALRTGHLSPSNINVTHLGAGLILEDRLPLPIDIRLDYSISESEAYEALTGDKRRDSYSVNIDWAF